MQLGSAAVTWYPILVNTLLVGLEWDLPEAEQQVPIGHLPHLLPHL